MPPPNLWACHDIIVRPLHALSQPQPTLILMMLTRTPILPNDQCFHASWWSKAQIPKISCKIWMMMLWIWPSEGSPVRVWASSGWAQPYLSRSHTRPMLATSRKWPGSTKSLWRSPPTGLWTREREWQNSAELQRACPTRRSEMPSIPRLGIKTCPLWPTPTEFLSTETMKDNQQEPSSWHSKRLLSQRKYGWASSSLMYISMFHLHADASSVRNSATIPRSVEPESRYAKHALPQATARTHAQTLTTPNAWTVKVHTPPRAGIVRDLRQRKLLSKSKQRVIAHLLMHGSK